MQLSYLPVVKLARGRKVLNPQIREESEKETLKAYFISSALICEC